MSTPPGRPPARRVAFTGDFLRFRSAGGHFLSPQARVVNWLREIVTAGTAWHRPGLTVDLVFPQSGSVLAGAGLLKKAALADYEADAELAWARRFDVGDPGLFQRHFDTLGGYDLVVGFELPPTLKRFLHRHGKRYISFHIHALRMLRDLCLGATTNCPAIAAQLGRFVVPAQEISSQVHRHRALCRFHNLPMFRFPAGLPVLVGQTERDSVLIQDGRFHNWADCRDQTHELLRDHDGVILLQHPGRADSLDIAEELRSAHGKTVFSTTANGYAVLLSNEHIPLVITLASSLGVEAQIMGLPTSFLLGDPQQRMQVPGLDIETTAPLGHGVLSDAFWSSLLGLDTHKRPPQQLEPESPFQFGSDYLRGCLDAWAFKLLRDGLAGATNRTQLLPAANLTPERQMQCVAQLGMRDVLTLPDPRPGPDWRLAGIELSVLDRPLGLGESRRIDFSLPTLAMYLAKGFHRSDGWCVWSSQRHAQIRVPVSADAVVHGATLQIDMEIRAYEATLGECPAVRISSGGVVLALALFRPSSPEAQHIQLTLKMADACCIVDLESTDLQSPALAGGASDLRMLGFILTRLDLQCMANEIVAPAETARLAVGDAGRQSLTIKPKVGLKAARA